MLVQDEYLAILSEAKVGGASFDENPAQQYATWRPDINAITTSRVNISVNIAFDSIWDALIRKGKETSIDEEGLA